MFPQAPETLNATTLGILAGGRGSRLGGRDKGLLAVHGMPLAGRLVSASGTGFADILINCNRSPWFYSHYGRRIVGDLHPNAGPLGGVMALVGACETTALLIIPCDLVIDANEVLGRLEAFARRHGAAYMADTEGRHNGCLLAGERGLRSLRDILPEAGSSSGLLALFKAIGAVAVAMDERCGDDVDDLNAAVLLTQKKPAGSRL